MSDFESDLESVIAENELRADIFRIRDAVAGEPLEHGEMPINAIFFRISNPDGEPFEAYCQQIGYQAERDGGKVYGMVQMRSDTDIVIEVVERKEGVETILAKGTCPANPEWQGVKLLPA